MFYPIGNTTIDSNKYREKFAKRYYLPFMKELIDLSGCSLKEAKELIDLVIHEEGIIVSQTSEEIQDTCLAELQDD
ncbi:hypothetical protein ACQKMI_11170 [Lysinibacillus sp. NPDC097214]|uniref:hypothetical protein n=1 Tax=Lysinibacillus sp. NPDC097214 TaxID=3390584 RepID=UPI003D04E681